MQRIFGIEFAQAARGADECAARAEACDEMRDAAFGLIPDFVGGAVIVGLPVRGIAVLIGIKIFFRIGGDDFVDFANGAVGGFVARSHDEFGAERGEDALAFVRSAVGQSEFDGIAERGADHGVGDAGVAAGGVDDGFAGSESAGFQAGLDHAECGAVFDGAAGIEPFGFGGEFDVGELAADAFESQQRRVADAIEDGLPCGSARLAVLGRRGSRWGTPPCFLLRI